MAGAQETGPLRTRVYVDGYNLYYGCLKGTPYKWLDPIRLMEGLILPSVLMRDDKGKPYSSELLPCALKFFTAKILTRAARAEDSVSSQAHYHNALRKTHGNRIEIVEGYYSMVPAKARVYDPNLPKRWPRDCPETTVWKLEEKQSDVNLALHALRDALMGEVDHIVIVTNDTDIAPAAAMIRAQTNVKVGIVVPTTGARYPNTDLVAQAHWHRVRITEQELSSAQLPRVIQGSPRPTLKPMSWYPRPEILAQVFEKCSPVFNNKSSAIWRWLLSPNHEYFGGREPIDLCSDDAGFAEFEAYLAQWNARNNSKD